MANLVDKQCKDTVWLTPSKILDPVRTFFGEQIPFDPCTEPDNPTNAKSWLCQGGIEHQWYQDSLAMEGTFVNPPYGSAIKIWIEKINLESQMGVPIIALLPASRWEQKYWQDNVLSDTLKFMCLIRSRVSFLKPGGGIAKGNPYPSILYFYENQNRLWFRPKFYDCFKHLGLILCPQIVSRAPK